MVQILQLYTSIQDYINSWRHPVPKKTEHALKLGVLAFTDIDAAAVIHPVQTHPDVTLHAIASQDTSLTSSFASKYNFTKSYDSYEDLLDDPHIDFVYIALPVSLHFEWAFKALSTDKHVLVDMPFTSNAKEAEILVRKSEECGKVLMEACSWQFHPAAQRFRQILDSKEFGGIIKIDAAMASTPHIPPSDVRWKYDFSGGSLMNMTPALGLTRFVLREATPDVVHATATPSEDPRVDSSMLVTMRFKLPDIDKHSDQSNVYSTIYTDMSRRSAYGIIPRLWELPSIRVETDLAEIYFYNAATPHIYHYIAITIKETGKTSYERVYKGGPLWKDRGETFWSTYRYQLEAFVDKLRGRHPVWWIEGEDSIAQMRTVDAIYTQSGLPLRPTSIMVD